MRITLVFVLILLVILFGLPTVLRGDETLSGRVQTFLAYSLGALSIFASLTTLFFSCHTLAGEIKSNVIHLLVTKPVSRLEILAGKWLGVNLLNLVLVGVCGLMIYLFAVQISRGKPAFGRDAIKLQNVVWTSRVAIRPKQPDYVPQVEAFFKDRAERGETTFDLGAAKVQKLKELDAEWRTVAPGSFSVYEFEDLPTPHGSSVVQVTFKAIGSPPTPNDRLPILWQFLDPESRVPLTPEPMMTEGRSGDMHEFLINAEAVVKNGRALIAVINPAPPEGTHITFEQDRGILMHYRVTTFEANYGKSLATLLFRLAFLSAIGLFFGVFVSFPVACACTATFYIVGLGHSWWMESIGANIVGYTVDVDPYGHIGPAIRFVLVPLMTLIFPDFGALDGTAKLLAGENISWGLLARAAGHTLAFGGVALFSLGWFIFSEREIAEVQV